MRLATLVFATALAVGSCADQGPEIPTFDGRWSGTLQTTPVEITVNENDTGAITGSGTFGAGNQAIAFELSGVHSHPDVSFTMSSTGLPDVNFSGDFEDDNTVEGRFAGGGLPGDLVTFTRQ